jgi:hypothetical protein
MHPKESIAESLNKTQKENRRLELNKNTSSNQRIKLGLSRKDYKKYKLFNEAYAKKIEYVVSQFYIDLASSNITLEEDGVVEFFDKWDKYWRDWARYKVNKLELHSRKGKVEIIEKFTSFVTEQINIIGKGKSKEGEFASNPITMELFQLAISYNVPEAELSTIENVTEFTVLIAELKKLIPRGKKIEFEVKAKTLIKKVIN